MESAFGDPFTVAEQKTGNPETIRLEKMYIHHQKNPFL